MYGYVYQTTNKINNKKYIGITHYSRIDHESYLGSGKIIKWALRKYGKDAFKKEILEECASFEDLIEAEGKWISKYDATDSMEFYNIMPGGHGGYSEGQKKYWSQYTAEERKTARNWGKPMLGRPGPNKGKKASAETRAKIGAKSVNRNWNKPTTYNGAGNPNSKPVEIYWHETGLIEHYDCLKDFAKKHNYNYSSMRMLAQRETEYSPKYKVRIKYV